MERLVPGVGTYGRVGRFRPEQIANMETWNTVPEGLPEQSHLAALNHVRLQRHHASTIVHVNPLDPAYDKWRECPGDDSCHCPKPAFKY